MALVSFLSGGYNLHRFSDAIGLVELKFTKMLNYNKYFTVFYNIPSIYHPFCPRKSSKAHSCSYLYTGYVSCMRLKTYFFVFDKSNIPGFSPNFRFRKPVLKFAF